MSKTVKVRIAVAVNERGDWVGQGWNRREYLHEDKDMKSFVFDHLDDNHSKVVALHWVEAELPVPERPQPVTVNGTATPTDFESTPTP